MTEQGQETGQGWRQALESLVPMGSEFVDNPTRCAEFVRQRLETTGRIAAERNDLERQLAEAIARAETAERENKAAWGGLAPIDGHESLAKAISNAIQRRNRELLEFDSALDKAESEAEALRAKAGLADEIASKAKAQRKIMGFAFSHLSTAAEWDDWLARYDALSPTPTSAGNTTGGTDGN